MTPAPEAGGMPRTRPGIRSVGLFGSLARSTAVDHRSDVDVAVTGGAGGTGLFAGVANPLELDPEIEVALVMLETARPTLAPPIGAEGISL
jgi:predicted nucleotidyltransferase